MDEQDINKKYIKVTQLLKQQRLKEAHQFLFTLLGDKGEWELRNRLEQAHTSYQYMLQYMQQGVEDPGQKELYHHILTETWELADQIRITLLDEVSSHYFHSIHKTKSRMAAGYRAMKGIQILEAFQDDLAVCQLLTDHSKSLDAALKRHEEACHNLFVSTWSNTAWNQEDRQEARYILNSKLISSNDRSLFVSAVTLSLQECFDVAKLTWLLEAAATLHQDVQSTQRALVGIALTLIRHPKRIALYPELTTLFEFHDEQYHLGKQLNTIYLQLLRAQETEKVNKRIKEDIFPEMIKQANFFKGKLFKFEDMSDEEDFNPDWEKSITDSGLEDKLREMGDLQIEGMDVNMNTFSQLKHYPFFSNLDNWLLPFDWNHSSIRQSLGTDLETQNTILNMLLQSGMFCNSDKYSLCFLLYSIPESQRDMILHQFTSQGTEELMNSDKWDYTKKMAQRPEIISNQYIQDLYRFYTLSQRRKEFFNPFEQEITLHRISVLQPILNKAELLKEIADYRIRKEYWTEALDILQLLMKQPQPDAYIYQKAGYCYQKLKYYTDAIEAYMKADVLKPDHLWTIRHLATCYRHTQNYEKAAEYYQKVLTVQPENQQVILFLGNCLAELKHYNEAMNYFFKLDFMEDNNVKAWRSIGWYSFICGKQEQAVKYYQKVLETSPSASDYLNAGYIAWKSRQLKKVTELFKKCLLAIGSTELFLETIHKDKEILLAQGIPADEIPLVLDTVI